MMFRPFPAPTSGVSLTTSGLGQDLLGGGWVGTSVAATACTPRRKRPLEQDMATAERGVRQVPSQRGPFRGSGAGGGHAVLVLWHQGFLAALRETRLISNALATALVV